MTEGFEVLFVDDDADIRRAATQLLELANVPVRTAASAAEALPALSRNFAGVLVTDIRMPGFDGMELMRKALEIDPDLPVILVTGHGDIDLAVDAMRTGAYDFIEKPFATERFVDSIVRAVEKRQLTLENRKLRDKVASRWDNLEARLAGRTPIMIELRNRIRAVAQTPSDVLIIGDTGTGKEIAARAIHDLSGDGDRPFVTINCAALPTGMIDQELFGYEVGAFSGATRARFGKFEHARNGTVFLDEIDAMPLDVQAKLLRVVQDRTVTRLGSHDAIPLNARFIAASKVDLESAAANGAFRGDLLYRLNVMTLHMPPLSRRRDDIAALFALLSQDAAARYRVEARKPGTALLMKLAMREWPGNVRELRNAAERFVLGLDGQDEATIAADVGGLPERVMAFERQVIAAELEANGGRLKPTYEALRISRKTLYEKMQKYGMDRSSFRSAG